MVRAFKNHVSQLYTILTGHRIFAREHFLYDVDPAVTVIFRSVLHVRAGHGTIGAECRQITELNAALGGSTSNEIVSFLGPTLALCDAIYDHQCSHYLKGKMNF